MTLPAFTGRLRVIVVLGVVCSLAPPLANAAAPTRDEYKAEVEPICKTNTRANERILAGVRGEVREGRLKVAGAKFAKAARALKRTLTELQAVPRPKEDRPRLAKWLGYVQAEVGLFEAAARKLRSGDTTGAQRMVVRLVYTANRANNQVFVFDFQYCRFMPAKFT